MTKLLREAFEKASKLPEPLQDELAQEVLDEIVWELKWDESLARSSAALDAMARKALADMRSGQTEPKGMDEL